eukprot:8021793-Alexandrium_andersonii.AAC.1
MRSSARASWSPSAGPAPVAACSRTCHQASFFADTWRGAGRGDCAKAARAICAATERLPLGPQVGSESELGTGAAAMAPAWSVDDPCPACGGASPCLLSRRHGRSGAVLSEVNVAFVEHRMAVYYRPDRAAVARPVRTGVGVGGPLQPFLRRLGSDPVVAVVAVATASPASYVCG